MECGSRREQKRIFCRSSCQSERITGHIVKNMVQCTRTQRARHEVFGECARAIMSEAKYGTVRKYMAQHANATSVRKM